MKRRNFLQQASWILAALGLSGADLLRLEHYHQALAQPSPRKLALLVGINQYPQIEPLSGCITDLELQQELLIHRFGFQPADILTLKDQQASRQQIETAFLEHLTAQARPGDSVLLHFSGYGRQLQLEGDAQVRNSLVPVDHLVTTSDVVTINDLLEETLWLLLRSLATERVLTILDTSYDAVIKDFHGSLRIRTRPTITQGQLSIESENFRAQLLEQQQGLIAKRPLPGIILTAANINQVAAEGQWTGFSAGLFTYALTQYLWEATPATTVQTILSQVTGMLEQVGSKQRPTLDGRLLKEQSLLNYYLLPEFELRANGVVTAVAEDGKTAHLWLAGIPLPVLEAYGVNSVLEVVSPIIPTSEPAVVNAALQLQIRSRNGLTAKAQLHGTDSVGTLQVGQLVQELIRVLPRSVGLIVALDSGLERIERVDATSAFAAIPHVSSVRAGEQPADYLFARLPEAASRYGLFSLSQELISDTAGEPGEAVKVAVQRLVPKLQTLLAAKLWRLTTNAGSTRLKVKASLEVVNTHNKQILLQTETLPPKSPTVGTKGNEVSIPTVAIGSRIQYQVYNYSDRPVYMILLGLDSSKNGIALYPIKRTNETTTTDSSSLLHPLIIAPGETLTLPHQTSVDFEWIVHGPTGIAENQLIFSSANFSQTLAVLASSMHRTLEKQEHIGSVPHPVEVAQAVLQDLHQASGVDNSGIADTYALDVNTWASLSFVYQVV